MCLSCAPNESPGGGDAARHIDAPFVNAMICSRWMCKILMWPSGTTGVSESATIARVNNL